MAAFCVLEFDAVNDMTGEPVFPPIARTVAQAFGAALTLNPATKYVLVTPDANFRVRISYDGSAAAAGDPQVLANETRGFYVKDTAAVVYAYGLAG